MYGPVIFARFMTLMPLLSHILPLSVIYAQSFLSVSILAALKLSFCHGLIRCVLI